MVSKRKSVVFVLIAMSFLSSITYSHFLSFTDRGLPIHDPFSLIIHGAWFLILLWISYDVYKEKKSAKGTLIFLAGFVGVLTVIDVSEKEIGLHIIVAGILESLLLLCAGLIVQKGKTKSNQTKI